jgi:hypothetical protein
MLWWNSGTTVLYEHGMQLIVQEHLDDIDDTTDTLRDTYHETCV